MWFLIAFVLVPFPFGWLAARTAGKPILWLSYVLTFATSVFAIWIPLFWGFDPAIVLMIPFVLFAAGAFCAQRFTWSPTNL